MRTLIALALLATSCGKQNLPAGETANPQGTVAGIVIEAGAETPVAGVEVQVIAGEETLKGRSDDEGVFRVRGVPAGKFVLSLEAAGFVPVTLSATLSSSDGDYTIANPQVTLGPIGLVASTGSFTLRLVGADGTPAPGIVATARTRVRWVDYRSTLDDPGVAYPYNYPYQITTIGRGSYSVTATSDAEGVLRFTGLPDYTKLGGLLSEYYPASGYTYIDQLTVALPPVAIQGSPGYAFPGGSFSFFVARYDNSSCYAYPYSPCYPSKSAPTLVLAEPGSALQVIESNLDYLRYYNPGTAYSTGAVGSMVPASGRIITVAFNDIIDASSLRAQLFREDGSISPVQPNARVDGNLLSLQVDQPLAAGQRYNLSLAATAALNAQQPSGSSGSPLRSLRAVAPFFVEPAAGEMPSIVPLSPKLVTGADGRRTIEFRLSEPIGLGAGSTAATPCVAFYEGANFDGNPAAWFQGEWSADLSNLVCPALPPPSWDVTRIIPSEPTGPITGFATNWRIDLDPPTSNGACAKNVTCTMPPSGTRVHLVFARSQSTILRANGQPLSTLPELAFVIP